MRILIASPYSYSTQDLGLNPYADEILHTNDHPNKWPDADWVISYGYRQIIKQETIGRYCNRIINIHMACLPWNRGADPNLWSWIDNTPKGVTIHQVDAGIDTGPIYSKLIVHLHNKHTLKSSYEELRRLAEAHFAAVWPAIRNSSIVPVAQHGEGTYHRSKDKDELFNKLPLGWDTPVRELSAWSLPVVAEAKSGLRGKD